MINAFNWIVRQGISANILLMLLYIPIIATFINFTKYIVGTKSFNIYAPLLLSFALLFTGFKLGIITIIVVVTTTLLIYHVFRRYRMHYASRTTLIYIFVPIFLIITYIIISSLHILSEYIPSVSAVQPLGIILITGLADFFVKQYIKRDLYTTLRALGGTIVISIIGWMSIRWVPFQHFVSRNFIWIFITLVPLNLVIGKYTGLRWKDFIRFKDFLTNE
jgi:hypothetical protein